MNGGYSADYSHRSRHFYESFKVSIVVLTPPGVRGVVAGPRGVRVCSSLYGASIVPSCKADRCDPVHDPFVVSCAPVRVCGCKGVGVHNPINNSLTSQGLLRYPNAGSCDSSVCEI